MPISIEPTNPTTDTAITFNFFTFSKCPEVTKTIEGSEFIFEVQDRTSGVCLSTAAPFELIWEIGTLDAGEYQITHLSPWLETETQSFVVVEGAALPPAAAIPALGPISAPVLVVALALIAGRLLLRRRVAH